MAPQANQAPQAQLGLLARQAWQGQQVHLGRQELRVLQAPTAQTAKTVPPEQPAPKAPKETPAPPALSVLPAPPAPKAPLAQPALRVNQALPPP